MRKARFGGTALFFVLVLSSAALAQSPPPPAKPVAPGVVPNRPPPAPQLPSKGGSSGGRAVQGMAGQVASTSPPNLAILALWTNAQCEIKVMVKNQGAALQGTEDITYYLKRDAPATGDLAAKIPVAQLQASGSVATVTFPGLLTDYNKAANFTASIPSSIRDHRAGALDGTSVTNSLKCGGASPKLDMAIRVNDDCTKTVLVRNVGSPLAAATWVTYSVERVSDGWTHRGLNGGLDRFESGETKELKDSLRTFEKFKYTVRGGQGGGGTETIEQMMPDRCRGPKPPYVVDLAEVATDRTTCKVRVTLKNKGTVPLPNTLQIPIDLSRDGAPRMTVHADGGAMSTNPGGTISATSNMVLGIPMANVSVTIKLPTGNLGPKIFPLNCQK